MNTVSDSTAATADDCTLAFFICTLVRAGAEFKFSHVDPLEKTLLGTSHVKGQTAFTRNMLELLRSNHEITFRPMPNALGGLTEGEIILVRRDVESLSPQAEFQSFKSGMAVASPLHSRFDLFEPRSLIKKMKFLARHFAWRRKPRADDSPSPLAA